MRFLMLTAFVLFAVPAMAQDDNSEMVERLDRLERDVSFVQKQIYRDGAGGGTAPVNSGQMQVRFTQMDEEFRHIRGLIEQVQFQNRQIETVLKKLSDDVDFRLRALEEKTSAPLSSSPVADDIPYSADYNAAAPVPKPESLTDDAAKPATYTPESKEKPALTGKDFPDANAHYSYAFKLLNDKKYSDAAASFDAFVKKYPTDPLTSNAFYWLGESQYVRNDFTRSAESFRKGFESNPDGQKAPDNLYKLAMSLSQIKRRSEACIVLAQVVNKYAESAARTVAKAGEARTSLQCK